MGNCLLEVALHIWHSFTEAQHGLGQKATAISIGTFDGVHRGHQAIVGELCRQARERSLVSLVITFAQHPSSIVKGDAPPLLLPVEERLELLGALGVEAELLVEFDAALAASSPETFVREYLQAKLGLNLLVIGHDFRFGAGGCGDADFLTGLGPSLGFSVIEVPPVILNGTVVSSTAIRWALAAGDVKTAARFLGRIFAVRGQVVTGQRRGQTLGFPTANIRLAPGALWPRFGVYLVLITFGQEKHYGVANVGVKPTFGRNEPGIEVFLFRYQGNLYHKMIEASFLGFLRPEKHFDKVADLQAQIRADIEQAGILLSRGIDGLETGDEGRAMLPGP